MSNRFSFSKSNDSGPHGHWFRIGTLEVTTTVLFVLLSVVSILVQAFAPSVSSALALSKSGFLSGRVWALVTWPFGLPGISILTIIALAVMWMFGRELEHTLGRFGFARFLLGCTLILGLLGVALNVSVFGPALLQFVVLLTFIAHHPQQRFFFNIPGWVIGAVFVALQVLSFVSTRYWAGLLHFLLGLALCAVLAKTLGLLGDLKAVPSVPKPQRKPRRTKGASPTVVAGPWPSSGAVNPDQAALDALLDKISASGIDSLSAREKKQLMQLRDRLRGN